VNTYNDIVDTLEGRLAEIAREEINAMHRRVAERMKPAIAALPTTLGVGWVLNGDLDAGILDLVKSTMERSDESILNESLRTCLGRGSLTVELVDRPGMLKSIESNIRAAFAMITSIESTRTGLLRVTLPTRRYDNIDAIMDVMQLTVQDWARAHQTVAPSLYTNLLEDEGDNLQVDITLD
jgi:hypothetical protein